MKTIQVNGHTKPDGTLDITVSTGLPESHVEVLLVVQVVAEPDTATAPAWPPGFFERTAGKWRGRPLARADQGDFEQREKLR